VSDELQRPLLVYDGDCSFCRRWITRWRYLTRDVIEYQPCQAVAERLGRVPREQFGRSVVLFEPDQRITTAAHAVFRALSLSGRKRYLLWSYRFVPGFARIAEALYGLVSRHRDGADKLDRLLLGREAAPSTYLITRSVFIRLLGAIYLIAFVSMYVQMDGLIGSHGILPARAFLDAVRHDPRGSWMTVPTLAWISSNDAFLHAMCLAGIGGSIVVIAGLLPMPMLAALWVGYLSLVSIAGEFLSFQWDLLLLETGFLAIFFAPPLSLGSRRGPSRLVLLLLHWLLFRLMFLSGLVKLTWDDPTWRSLQALRYHYQTQPLPAWTSWYAHHLPDAFQRFSCVVMFIIELAIPFLFFAPRRLRFIAFWATVIFQLLIMATGNYGFFNLLAIALCITLLDDFAWPRWMRRRLPDFEPIPWRWPIVVRIPLAGVIVLISAIEFGGAFREDIVWPSPMIAVYGFASPFRSINGYGLFRVMTTERFELIVEGSNDGRDWKPYAFRWKPGDLTQRPRFCEPYMPRLDWQMWFAALQPQPPQWFLTFVIRLLQGEPKVLALLKGNPFPDHPPRYIRVLRYRYSFTDRRTKQQTGAWWDRQPVDVYLPPVSFHTETPRGADFRL
jgi:predicted DCC family thiol-disulfide oxidoreductase YuxK